MLHEPLSQCIHRNGNQSHSNKYHLFPHTNSSMCDSYWPITEVREEKYFFCQNLVSISISKYHTELIVLQ